MIDVEIAKSVTVEQWIVIDKIARRLAKKYTFGYYDKDDIAQVGRMFGLNGLLKYDEECGPLENFLSIHIRNRLHNFKRDNYFRADQPKNKKSIEKWEKRTQTKINLLQPVNIDGMDEHFPFLENHLDNLAFEELIKTINEKLPANLRTDFLRMNADVKIPNTRKVKVQEAISKILEEMEDEQSKVNHKARSAQ